MLKLKYIVVPFVAIILFRLYNVIEDNDGNMVDDDIVYSDVVMTSSGPVRGKLVIDDEMEVRYYAYLGIPYAESPSGPMRFKPPISKKPWTEVLNATEVNKSCIQFKLYLTKQEMSEDCLFLNIFVPENYSSPLAVLVMIHGGGFQFEPIPQRPVHLGPHLLYVKHNVMVVTVNFRLGVFGYFCLDIKESTGNNQLKDILLSLNWIKTNIDRFGGDKTKVTLIGYSSGAAAIGHLMTSEKSKDLFQQAIFLSGSPLGYKMFGRYPKQNSIDLAHELGIEDDDPYVILEKMKKIDPHELVLADDRFAYYEDRRILRRPTRFLPHAEINSSHAVIINTPKNLLETGKLNDVKVLKGISEEERFCIFNYLNRYTIKEINNDIELIIPSDIEYPKNSEKSKELAKLIHNFYFNGSNITMKSMDQFTIMSGDAQFTKPTHELLNYYKKLLSEIYYCIFNFNYHLNFFAAVMETNYTTMAHADMVFYVINSELSRNSLINNDVRAIRMSQKLLHLTSNFIKYGDPTPQTYEGIKWPNYRKGNQFLEIGENLNVKSKFSDDMTRRIEFWQKVYDDYEQYVREGGPTEPKIVP